MRLTFPKAKEIAKACGKDSELYNGWFVCCCPAHDDHHPSLSVKDGTKPLRNGARRTLLKCHAGCEFDKIVDALIEHGVVCRRE